VAARRVWGRHPSGKVGEGRAISREKVVFEVVWSRRRSSSRIFR